MTEHIVRWNNNEPYSEDYQDFYFSPGLGRGAAQHIFLQGNKLPEAWQNRSLFCIGELGFGTGVNFFETLLCWNTSRKPGQRLHFVSVEKHPFSPSDLQRALAQFPDYHKLNQSLSTRLPLPISGFHRVGFPEYSAWLTLGYGDAEQLLKQFPNDLVDAWYFDGFSPSKNPDMWSHNLLSEVFRSSKAGASFATFSAAGTLRRTLESIGFRVEKFPGFQQKRESLRGNKPGQFHEQLQSKKKIGILGAGLAGCTLADACAQRGADVHLFESASQILNGASGNPLALFNPYPYIEESVLSAWTSLAFLHARQWYLWLEQTYDRKIYDRTQSLQFLSTKRLQGIADAIRGGTKPPPLLEYDLQQQDHLCYPESGQITPPTLREVLLQHFRQLAVAVHLQTDISDIQYRNHTWQLTSENTSIMQDFDVIFLANSSDCLRFTQTKFLPVESVRGQLALVRDKEIFQDSRVQCFDGYLSAPIDGMRVLGTSYDHASLTPEARAQDNVEMIERAARWLGKDRVPCQEDLIDARVSFRCSTYDRFPFVGPLPDWSWMGNADAILERGREAPVYPQLFLSTGFGSRGFSSCSLAAEILAAEIFGECPPVPAELRQALLPSRATRRLFRQIVEK